MNKVYLNSMIILAVVLALLALFGTSNHFMAYYDPDGSVKKTANNTPNTPKKPDPQPNPDPNPPSTKEKDINGYKCKYENCQILNGTSLISEKYLFIVDGTENVVLFDVTTLEVVKTYKSVIPAGTSYVAKDENDKYGIVSVFTDIKDLVPFEYTFIEYKSDNDQFIITKDSNSYVADNTGKKVTLTYNAQIIQYNKLYIVTRTSTNEYHVFNYNNSQELTEYVNSKRIYIELVDNYVGIITSDYVYKLYDFRDGNKLLCEYQLEEGTTTARGVMKNTNALEIYANDRLVKTVEF